MAPRKKSKGKKPPETMRQRQMRLRKMERQLKSSTKQLPPGKKGGALVKSGSSKPMSPRLKAALDKKAQAAKGTTGGSRAAGGRGLAKQTPRLPAGKSRFAKSAYGQDIQALKDLVKQGGKKGMAAARQLVKLGVQYAPAAKLLGLTAAKAAPGVALAAGVASSAGRKGQAKMSRLGISKDGNAPTRRLPTNKVGRSQATSRKVGPAAKEGGYTISKKAREAAKKVTTKPTKPSTTTTSTRKTTASITPPRKRAKPDTTGVGPVKSGRSYSVGVSGKSVTQQRADELRQMQERSRKRQAEQRKSMEAAKKKKEQQQRRKRTSR